MEAIAQTGNHRAGQPRYLNRPHQRPPGNPASRRRPPRAQRPPLTKQCSRQRRPARSRWCRTVRPVERALDGLVRGVRDRSCAEGGVCRSARQHSPPARGRLGESASSRRERDSKARSRKPRWREYHDGRGSGGLARSLAQHLHAGSLPQGLFHGAGWPEKFMEVLLS